LELAEKGGLCLIVDVRGRVGACIMVPEGINQFIRRGRHSRVRASRRSATYMVAVPSLEIMREVSSINQFIRRNTRERGLAAPARCLLRWRRGQLQRILECPRLLHRLGRVPIGNEFMKPGTPNGADRTRSQWPCTKMSRLAALGLPDVC
jgi:hypothetical protein